MKDYLDDLIRIKELLRKYPKGMSISEISQALSLHRNTSAKYLDLLKLKGDVDRKQIGTAKNYFLVQRMPVSAFVRFCTLPLIILNNRQEVVMVNNAALNLLKCPLEVLYGEKIEEVPYTFSAHSHIEDLCHQAVQGLEKQFTIRMAILKEKHEIHIHLIPVVFDTGKDGCALVLTDGTAMKKNAAHLKELAHNYEVLTSTQTEWIVHMNTNLKIIFANKALLHYIGKEHAKIIGTNFLSLFQRAEQKNISALFSQLSSDNNTSSGEIRSIRRDGSVGWEEWIIYGHYDTENICTGYQVFGRDCTRTKQCEEKLSQYHQYLETIIADRTRDMQDANKALLNAISEKEDIAQELRFTQFAFDNASDSILLIHESGQIHMANKTAEVLLGYSHDELTHCFVFTLNPSISMAEWKNMWESASVEKKERHRSILKKKDGSTVDVEFSRTFVRFGDQMYFCSIAREM